MPPPNEEQPNPEKTGYDCALCEKPNHADSNMVCCDKCRRWSHFKCAGVTADVINQSWMCKDCSVIEVTEHSNTDSSELSDPEASKNSDVEQRADSDQGKTELQHKEELRRIKAKFDRQLRREKEKMVLQLRLEREMLQLRKAAADEFNKKRSDLYREFESSPESSDQEEANAAGQSVSKRMQAKKKLKKVRKEKSKCPVKHKHGDSRGAYPKSSTPKRSSSQLDTVQKQRSTINKAKLKNLRVPKKKPEKVTLPPHPVPKPDISRLNRPKPRNSSESAQYASDSTQDESESSQGESDSTQNKGDSTQDGSEYSPGRPAHQRDETKLTRAQLAARKGPFSKLPVFTGRPEEWPMFISSYNNGNTACNWTNLENLGRLQESIRGPALEAVRSRLLLPESVPKVIATLQLLYGRAEQLLHSLMQKARKDESPCADRLDTCGMVVQ